LGLSPAIIAAIALDACLAPLGIAPGLLDLQVHLDPSAPFEDAPRYYALELRNTGHDTVWVAPFTFASEDIEGLLSRDGVPLRDWGIVCDYVTPPNWHGIPVPPSSSVFDVGLLQDRWGGYVQGLQGLYQGRQLPPGQYRLSASFHFGVDEPGTVQSLTAAD